MSLAEDRINESVEDDVIDINLEEIKKKKFRINGDSTAIIELNTSDLGIVDRLSIGLNKIQEEMSKIAQLSEDDETVSEFLKKADANMREGVDYIFDYPVSAVCARYGTMYDPKDGKFRYETIIEGLIKLYTDNIRNEYKKIEERMSKHINKYTKGTN